MDATEWLKSQGKIGKVSDGAFQENAGGNDTVLISEWRG